MATVVPIEPCCLCVPLPFLPYPYPLHTDERQSSFTPWVITAMTDQQDVVWSGCSRAFRKRKDMAVILVRQGLRHTRIARPKVMLPVCFHKSPSQTVPLPLHNQLRDTEAELEFYW